MKKTAAFSLVEVCLAIGVVSFAFVGILGLLPVGLTTFRTSMNNSVGSQIAQRVMNDVRQTDFETLTAGAAGAAREIPPMRYYDEAGNELQATDAARSLYHVRTVLTPATKLPGNAQSMPDLATLVVQVAVNPAQKKLTPGTTQLWASVPAVTVRNHVAYIARNR